ncbi:MAG: CAP domain-containing protein [Amaricoccus sp.]
MFRPLLAALAVLLAISACSSGGGEGRLTPADADPIRLRQLDAVNAVRTGAGLQPVQLSAELNAASETHARDMYVQQRAWHFGSDLTSPRERAFRAGYKGELVGENLAEGQDSDLMVLQSWLDFKDTRDVIMDPAARGLGLGWFQEPNSGKIWWVQLVGK